MALYWHPFLAEMLRLDYADRLLIREQVSLGDLPLEADLLLVRRAPSVTLPYPLNFLGQQTLIEFKSPDDTADQAALEQLEIYGLLYVRREKLARRGDLTLWLMGSQVAANVSQPGRTELVGCSSVGPGVTHGTLDGFPAYVVNLQAVPFSPDTMPLHMVSRGKQERALAEYIVSHYRQHPRQLDLLTHLHLFALAEVLMTHNLTPEQIGLDPDAVALFVAKFYPAKAFERMETDDLAKELLRRLGKEKALELLEQQGNPPAASGQSSS